MVDTPEAPVTPVVAPAAPASAPAITTPVAEAPTASIEAVASSVPAVETPVVAESAKVETPTPAITESVLGEPAKAAEAPVTEKKPDAAVVKPEGDKAIDAKADKPAVELPTYEAFKLPENVALDKEPLDAFTKILGEIETGKLDHLGMQEKGQALIDLATKATTDSITRLNDSYVQLHMETKKARFEALKADPDMGGDRLQDTIATLQRTVSEFGGTEAQIAEFRKEVSEAGIDASPALCRLIYNMQQKIDKYTTEGTDNRQVPASRPAPSKVKDYQRFYAGGN